MTVYVDMLFLTNGLVDYLLLRLTGQVVGVAAPRLRLIGAAAVGGGYAVGCVLPGGQWLCAAPMKLAVGILLVLLAYGHSGHLLRCVGVFGGLSCAMGGGLLLLSMSGGVYLHHGVILTPPDCRAILLTAAAVWWLLGLIFRGMGRYGRIRGELRPVTVHRNGRSITVSALVDTGNSLTDPVTGAPVLVLEWQEGRGLLPGITEEQVRNPARTVAEHADGIPWRLIPYRAVGTAGGMLLGVTADAITDPTGVRPETVVALTAQSLSCGRGYTALVGKDGPA